MKPLGFPFLLLAVSCGFPAPQPRDRWGEQSAELAAHEVLIEGELKVAGFSGHTLRGNGVIVSSSREKGTFILTCWHVACVPVDLLRSGDGVEASGPTGHKMSVFVHESASRAPGRWKEWKRFEGTVTYGKAKVLRNPLLPDETGATASFDRLVKEFSVLDVAVIRLETGENLLRPVTLNTGERILGEEGFVRGVDSKSGLPFRRPAYFLCNRFFAANEQSSSGSGVYDADGQLVGLLSARVGYCGTLQWEGRTQTFSLAHYFVPSEMILKSLQEAGLTSAK